MKKGEGTPENREATFSVYKEHGGRNIPLIIRHLKGEHGISISEQTLYEWMKDGDWKARLKRTEEERDKFLEGELLGFDEKMLKKILRQIERYERHLDTDSKVDNQAAYAYINMIRTAMELSSKIRPEKKVVPEEHERTLEEVLETEYGITP
jgi:hypothetical protein